MIEINESNFETEVLVRSHEMPVLVDFWADWCAPCKSLMPVLDKLYTDYHGQLQIVKINIDVFFAHGDVHCFGACFKESQFTPMPLPKRLAA